MKNRPLIWMFVALFLCVTAVSCRKYSGFKHGSGYYYQYHIVNEENEKPQTGDFVMVNMALRAGDVELSPMTQNNMLIDELYKGDIYCALRGMHLYDSATFIFDGPRFYEEFLGMGEYPYGKTPVYADVKLLRIMSKQSIEMAELQFKERRQRQKHYEDSLVKAYANTHGLTMPLSGGYYVCTRKGDGPKPSVGQTVEILFVGRRLDDSEFDRCTDPANPRAFEIGKNQVARGIEIVVQEMNVGDKITAVLPSSLVFGEKGDVLLSIPPNTPLVYDIELLRIVEN